MNFDLFRYEENFFNCRSAQIVMYLRSRKVPVDFYFYNALENTGDLYRHIFVDDRNRWQYENRCLHDGEQYRLLGVEFNRTHCADFPTAKAFIDEQRQRNSSVFIWLNNYYIPHKEHYAKKKSYHSFIIHDQKEEKGHPYLIQDPPKFLDYIDEATISRAYEDSPEWCKVITAPILHPIPVDKTLLLSKFAGWVRDYDDDFAFYDHARRMVTAFAHPPDDSQDSGNDRSEILMKLTFAFSMLFSSRFLFFRFLEAMSMDQEWMDLALTCSKASESIRGYLNKAAYSRRLNDALLNEKITALKETETVLMDRLKGSVNHG